MKVFVGSLLGILATWVEFCSWHGLLTFPSYSLVSVSVLRQGLSL